MLPHTLPRPPAPDTRSHFFSPDVTEYEDSPLNLGIDVEKSPEHEALENSVRELGLKMGLDLAPPKPRTHVVKGKEPVDENTDEVDFDCHICFETAKNPMVTSCGHLFCSDDLRQWLQMHPRCPVCAHPISLSTPGDVVLIHNRGGRRPSQSLSPPGPLSPAKVRHFPIHHTLPPLPPTAPNHTTFTLQSPPSSRRRALTPPAESISPAPELSQSRHYLHPLNAHHILAHQFSRILSLLGLAIILTALLKR
ncbi:hypothetical protein BOTBODRAFT_51323 [Botryobasidium botryosum FD-172 SS1]|uniref:RING-type E3 ubiquitin transferase n=1 Tax=Botryobasidium botryosum (strain FD-172 SS1) TaxID=930990 RepID=A0A067MZ32_BOTB1|nr:hypothetical protein BOTBODRAFT_51323 [Botryobasidium botryosum FD-172 SS1]